MSSDAATWAERQRLLWQLVDHVLTDALEFFEDMNDIVEKSLQALDFSIARCIALLKITQSYKKSEQTKRGQKFDQLPYYYLRCKNASDDWIAAREQLGTILTTENTSRAAFAFHLETYRKLVEFDMLVKDIFGEDEFQKVAETASKEKSSSFEELIAKRHDDLRTFKKALIRKFLEIEVFNERLKQIFEQAQLVIPKDEWTKVEDEEKRRMEERVAAAKKVEGMGEE
ncbi:uncharacterized protein J3D65DRAFT_177300 [Phyllosticta citribraziliensis]|uniref:Uncharacterized protein n=1 Tax=Phyllosticta citribraziliensis TaxID=989973 RepID=A0ABR1L3R0_9PEZI